MKRCYRFHPGEYAIGENEQFYGRSYADSPDIDGRVWIASDEPVTIGDFVWVKIDGCLDGDLSGYVVEEAEQ